MSYFIFSTKWLKRRKYISKNGCTSKIVLGLPCRAQLIEKTWWMVLKLIDIFFRRSYLSFKKTHSVIDDGIRLNWGIRSQNPRRNGKPYFPISCPNFSFRRQNFPHRKFPVLNELFSSVIHLPTSVIHLPTRIHIYNSYINMHMRLRLRLFWSR